MLRPSAERPLPALPRPKVPRGSASFLSSLRRQAPVRALGLMGHNLSITPGLRKTIEERVAVLPNSSGIGLNIKAAASRPRWTPLLTNDCQTSGHRSTRTLMSNSPRTILASTHDVCLGMYQALALDRSRLLFNSLETSLFHHKIRNTKRCQGYH